MRRADMLRAFAFAACLIAGCSAAPPPASSPSTAPQQAAPQQEASVRVGDVVIRFDGTPIATNADLQNAVARVPPHGKVPVEFWRGGQEKASSASIQF